MIVSVNKNGQCLKNLVIFKIKRTFGYFFKTKIRFWMKNYQLWFHFKKFFYNFKELNNLLVEKEFHLFQSDLKKKRNLFKIKNYWKFLFEIAKIQKYFLFLKYHYRIYCWKFSLRNGIIELFFSFQSTLSKLINCW